MLYSRKIRKGLKRQKGLKGIFTFSSLASLAPLAAKNENKPPFDKGRFGGNVNIKGGVPHHHYIKSNKGFPKEAFVLYEVIYYFI